MSQSKRGSVYARTVTELLPSASKMPACAKKEAGSVFWQSYYVPVSFAAKDRSVTPRRIRLLLAEGRLEGRRLDNGYWEVTYPYRYTIGTRGPISKQRQAPKRGRPKLEGISE